MAFSFGLLSTINGDVATISFIITVVFIVLFDTATNALESSLKGSAIYNSMLQRIYKELMMMGFVSFAVAMYQASTTSHSEQQANWIQAADFVGYVMFFVAIFFVVQAFYIMFLSITMCRQYADLDKASISDILVEFLRVRGDSLSKFLMKFRIIPILQVMKNVEFKIGWAVFRDTYVLPSQFDYVSYVSGCLQRYALRLVNIETTSWIFVIFLCILNYCRMTVLDAKCKSGFSNDDLDDPEQRHLLRECEQHHRLLFHIAGILLVVYVVMLFLVGRLYTFRIIGRAGVLGVDDYEDFLIFEEKTMLEHEQQKINEALMVHGKRKPRRGSVVAFKSAMERFMLQQAASREARAKSKCWLIEACFNMLPWTRDESTVLPEAFQRQNSEISSSSPHLSANLLSSRKSSLADAQPSGHSDKYIKAKEGNGYPSKLVKQATRLNSMFKFSEDLSGVFIMRSPDMFFKAVEIAIMLNSLYMSLWICNYTTTVSGIQHLLFVLPIVICLPIIGEIVKTASLIDCTASLNLDVIGALIEDLEDRDQMQQEIQLKLRQLPIPIETCMQEVNDMFTHFAKESADDTIDNNDFRLILRSLNIVYSNSKFLKAVHHADRNSSGGISRHELNYLLFPQREQQKEVSRRSVIIQGQTASRRRQKGVQSFHSTSSTCSTLSSDTSEHSTFGPDEVYEYEDSCHSKLNMAMDAVPEDGTIDYCVDEV